MTKVARNVVTLLVCCLVTASCARMGSPDGGWFDETPPRVVSTSPTDKGTGFNTQKVRIVFNEYIKIENATEKVIVSPPQLEQPEIKAEGKAIVVELKDSLKPNTTYTIDFSDAITDNNEGNPLGNYTYSFSTGSEIDTMEVSGYVLAADNLEPIKGIAVGLYRADAPDSVFRTEPLLRISRTDSRGHFVVKGIAPGSYRAFALQDVDGDYMFSQKSEQIAFSHDVFEPSSKPDTRYDTIWRDTLHIDEILPIPYTHFLPDDIVLRAFSEVQTDRQKIKTERTDPDRFTFFFSYDHEEIPEIRGLNFDEKGQLLVQRGMSGSASQKSGSKRSTGNGQSAENSVEYPITFWLRDTTLINQDTLRMEAKYHITDTLGVLVEYTDTLEMLPKQPYAKRLKQKQKEYDEWKKQQDKLKKRGEPYDSIMPKEPMLLKIDVQSQLDPDRNITLTSPYPFERLDTAGIHLYTKVDTLWYEARYQLKPYRDEHPAELFSGTGGLPKAELAYTLLGEWRPGQEYSLEIDSAAISDIYGNSCKAVKQGFKVKGYDAYSTLLFTLSGMNGKPVVAQLLNSSDAVIKEVSTKNGQAEFFYVTPGKYYLRIFVDSNENGVWDTGNYDEDVQPEAVYYYSEEIECKEKWDVTETWNVLDKPLFEQKPAKLVKQKGEKQKTIRSKNADRAKKLGIKAPEEN